MKPTLSMEAALDALAALQEARAKLGTTPEDLRLAMKLAAAAGRLRGAMINAVPEFELDLTRVA